jgi:FkbM family methyltransferase
MARLYPRCTLVLLALTCLPAAHAAVLRHNFTYMDRAGMLPQSFFEAGPELQIAGLVQHLLPPFVVEAEQATTLTSTSFTVLDIGMNTGYFSLLAASQGARVFSYEPQPLCVRLMRESLLAENAHLRKRLCVTNVAVGRSGVLEVPDSTCFGGFRGEATEHSGVNDYQNVLKVRERGEAKLNRSVSVLPASSKDSVRVERV